MNRRTFLKAVPAATVLAGTTSLYVRAVIVVEIRNGC